MDKWEREGEGEGDRGTEKDSRKKEVKHALLQGTQKKHTHTKNL